MKALKKGGNEVERKSSNEKKTSRQANKGDGRIEGFEKRRM